MALVSSYEKPSSLARAIATAKLYISFDVNVKSTSFNNRNT